MDLGALELQIFVSLTVILGAAFVALVCDYLKGHNEQLREQNIELRARRDEQERLAVLDPVKWLETLGERNRRSAEEPLSEVPAGGSWSPAQRPVLAAADSIRATFTRVDPVIEPEPVIPEIVSGHSRAHSQARARQTDDWTGLPPRRELLSLEEIRDTMARGTVTIESDKDRPRSSSRWSGLDIRSELKQMIKRTFGRRATPPAAAGDNESSGPPASQEPVVPEPDRWHSSRRASDDANGTSAGIDILDRIVGRSTPLTLEKTEEEPEPVRVIADSELAVETGETAIDVVDKVHADPEPPPQPAQVAFVPGATDDYFTEATAPIVPLPAVPEAHAEAEPETPSAPPVEPLLEALAQTGTVEEQDAGSSDLPACESATEESSPVKTEVALPPGLHDHRVLTDLLAAESVVTGVVFGLGITDYKKVQETQDPKAVEALLADMHGMIVDLLGAQHFAARTGEDAFILIFRNEVGAAAQRRINQVSERLWDFQLRSLGISSILFSWGAVEVQDEPLKSAVAAAVERMEQNRRSRKSGASKSTQRVVNG